MFRNLRNFKLRQSLRWHEKNKGHRCCKVEEMANVPRCSRSNLKSQNSPTRLYKTFLLTTFAASPPPLCIINSLSLSYAPVSGGTGGFLSPRPLAAWERRHTLKGRPISTPLAGLLEVKAGTCFLANLLGETLVQQKAGFPHPG